MENVNMKPIHKVYACIATDEQGNEGILTIGSPHGATMQAITPDFEIAKKMVSLSKVYTEGSGISLKVGEFERVKTYSLDEFKAQ